VTGFLLPHLLLTDFFKLGGRGASGKRTHKVTALESGGAKSQQYDILSHNKSV
jgi:hypothetical protein